MTQHMPLNYGDVVHQGFFDPIQELLGASMPSLRIKVANSTTLSITAGSGNDQVAVAIQGRYRFVTSTVTATLPGGLSSTTGTGNVFVTASDNNFGGGPTGPPDVSTDYAFGLTIRTTSDGNPSTALFRKVGEVDVASGAITAFRPVGGPRPSGDFGLVGTPDATTQPGLLVQGLSSQTASVVQVKNNSGTVNYQITAAGASTQAGGITVTGTDGVTLSGAGGKDTLNLSNTTADTGITIGDVEIYRTGNDAFQTDDAFTIRRTASADLVLSTKVTSDANDRISITAGGDIRFGSGAASPDVRLRRSGSNAATIDDGSGGATSLSVTGGLTVGTTLTLTQATTSGHVPISNGSGLMSLGTLASQSLSNSAVTTAKINDGAVTSAKILDGTIVNDDISASAAIAESKLSLASDAAAGTASRRTLGTSATQACAGNDSRLSDSRTPTGSAGGDLTGTYPNPTVNVSVSGTATAPSGGLTNVVGRKAGGLVTLGGSLLFASWPGYLTTVSVSGVDYIVLDLGRLPSGYRPTTDMVVPGIARQTSSFFLSTLMVILADGFMYGRVTDADVSAQPLRWLFDGITYAAA